MEPASGIVEIPLPEVPILWDIMEEYIDETEFAVERFEAALDDPDYNLQELAEGPEEKILACVDGLVIGGPAVVDRLLVPALESADSEEPARTVAVVLALLAFERRDLVAAYLFHASEQVRAATARGCALSDAPKVDAWLLDQLRNAPSGAERASVLDAIAARGGALDSLAAFLNSEDPAEVASAARAARFADARTHLGAIQWHVLQGAPEVRDAALVAALHFGSLESWNLCERLALSPDEPHATAMELYASLGEPKQHERLAEMLAVESHRASAVRALGFSGNPAMVDRLLPHLREGADPLEAKLATEAISLIAGLDLRDDAFVIDDAQPPSGEEAEEDELPPLDDDLDTDLAVHPEDALPIPNPEAIEQWWETLKPTLDPKKRHLAGTPWSTAAITSYLEHGTLRNRHMVASSLSIRTSGAGYVDTRAFAHRQRVQLAAVKTLDTHRFNRSYSQW